MTGAAKMRGGASWRALQPTPAQTLGGRRYARQRALAVISAAF